MEFHNPPNVQSVPEVEAKDEDDATDIARDMVNEGFSNYEVEVEDVNVSDVEQV
ncbi:uncharacterized protein METZ01_LOCUS279941 [marine metagenome]|uniref:Uncharacterized protein n=1 Tax=marine metagenome TaxID=408172 RepID=A0A382KWG2_9ZZZZ